MATETRRPDERPLPHSWETEKAVLGALLVAPERLPSVREVLSAEDFHRPAHAILFRIICQLADRGVPPDVSLVLDEIEEHGSAEAVGGIAYVAALGQVPAVVDHVDDYARRVGELATRRAAILRARTIEADVLEGRRVDQHLDVLGLAPAGRESVEAWHVSAAAERLLSRLDPARGRAGLARFAWPGGSADDTERTRAAVARGALSVARNPPVWSRTASSIGPLTAGSVAVLVGATGRGKSAYVLQIAEGAARAGAPVLYVSVEMDTDELVARLLALRAEGAAAWSSILLGAAHFPEVQEAAAYLCSDCPNLYLWAPGPAERTVRAIQRMARRVSLAHGGASPLVIVDYVQRLTPSGSDDRRLAVGDVSAGLRDLSRPGAPMGADWPGAAVIALSSTARSSYEVLGSVEALRVAAVGAKPTPGSNAPTKAPVALEGLGKESGELEYDAPILLVFTTDPPADGERRADPRRALLVAAKNRAYGGRALVDYLFHPASGRFVEAENNTIRPVTL